MLALLPVRIAPRLIRHLVLGLGCTPEPSLVWVVVQNAADKIQHGPFLFMAHDYILHNLCLSFGY